MARSKPGKEPAPRWKEDFPIEWERDSYIMRRELAKFLTLGSALLAATSAAIAIVRKWFWSPRLDGPRIRVAKASDVPPAGSLLFRYPTEEDPCILVRGSDGALRAYSQVCTHLACAVVHRPDGDRLFCPCHHGWFDGSSGRPVGGPPARPLLRVRLEIAGDDIYAVGREV
jgi:Rieske Fe-S protein